MSEPQEKLATILFVDDEINILASLKRLFRPFGYRIFTAESGVQGLEIMDREAVDLVVSDMRMPEMNGAQFLEKSSGTLAGDNTHLADRVRRDRCDH